MNGSTNRHSIIERIQDQQQSTFSIFQPSSSFFNNSSLEPESLEDFDFESAPMTTHQQQLPQTQLQQDDDEELIPYSSGLTSNSIVTSFTSTSPLKKPIGEEYCLKPIKDDSQETLKTIDGQHSPTNSSNRPQYVLRDVPFRNYQLFPGHTRFLLGGRLVTSKDYRAFIAALFILLTPTVLFAIFT
jgi:palmitoyltransferase ZDHHC9/14/18